MTYLKWIDSEPFRLSLPYLWLYDNFPFFERFWWPQRLELLVWVGLIVLATQLLDRWNVIMPTKSKKIFYRTVHYSRLIYMKLRDLDESFLFTRASAPHNASFSVYSGTQKYTMYCILLCFVVAPPAGSRRARTLARARVACSPRLGIFTTRLLRAHRAPGPQQPNETMRLIRDPRDSVLLLYATATTTHAMYGGCTYSTGISLSVPAGPGE